MFWLCYTTKSYLSSLLLWSPVCVLMILLRVIFLTFCLWSPVCVLMILLRVIFLTFCCDRQCVFLLCYYELSLLPSAVTSSACFPPADVSLPVSADWSHVACWYCHRNQGDLLQSLRHHSLKSKGWTYKTKSTIVKIWFQKVYMDIPVLFPHSLKWKIM